MEPPAALKSGPDGTQHSEWHHVTVSMVYLVVRTVLATSRYAEMPLMKYYTNGLPQICTSFEAVLHAKFTPGWALIRVNFNPIQEFWPKVRGGVLFFVSGRSFARLRYIKNLHSQCLLYMYACNFEAVMQYYRGRCIIH